MCGRYVSATSEPDLIAGFGVDRSLVDESLAGESLVADYNVAPTKPVPAVLVRSSDAGAPERQLRVARWGLVPPWARDPSIGSRTFNARIETAGERPAFRRAVRARRCLLPADGWYEWAAAPDGPRRAPHLLRRADGLPMAFAGLYEWWRDPSRAEDDAAAWLLSVSVVTRAAVPELAAIHHRMPVVLDPQAWADWLDPALDDLDAVRAMALTAPPDFAIHRVGPEVGDVRNEGASLAAPYAERQRVLF